MTYYNFLLVSRRNDDAFRIREELERNRLYQVQIVDSAPEALERMRKPGIHCMALNLESFTTDKMKMVTDIRDLGMNFPVMVLANYIQKEALDLMVKHPLSVIIEKPFESKDLWGIAQKLVQGVPVAQRIHRRFYTHQTTRVEKITSGHCYSGHVYNLSKGGAYIEVDAGRLQGGDLVRVTMQLSKVARAYNVDAEVVWASPRGMVKGRPAAGLRFISAGDVYRNLLQKL